MSSPIPHQPIEIFVSYSHKDEPFREELIKHLSILKRQGVITDWHDRKITAGSEWAGDIDDHLNSARIILLLISADFLASDYCYGVELHRALERHESGEAVVIPIILRPVDWQGGSFGKLQALPKDAKPITSWRNRDKAFEDIAKGIRAVVEALKGLPLFGSMPTTMIKYPAEVLPPKGGVDTRQSDKLSSIEHIASGAGLGNIQTRHRTSAYAQRQSNVHHVKPYSIPATIDQPALVIFLIDAGRHARRLINSSAASKLIDDALHSVLFDMVARSMKGATLTPKFHIGWYAYGAKIIDVYDGIQPLDRATRDGFPSVEPLDVNGDPYEAFIHAERLLKANYSRYQGCPAPLVCHISAGEYAGRDPVPVARRIMGMDFGDGPVLIENVLIAEETVLIPTNHPRLWAGIRDESELATSYARQLFRMSSVIPEPYRTVSLEDGYNLAPGSKMLYPGTQQDMLKLGLALTAATPTIRPNDV